MFHREVPIFWRYTNSLTTQWGKPRVASTPQKPHRDWLTHSMPWPADLEPPSDWSDVVAAAAVAEPAAIIYNINNWSKQFDKKAASPPYMDSIAYTLHWAALAPQNCPCPSGPHLIHGSLGQPKSTTQAQLTSSINSAVMTQYRLVMDGCTDTRLQLIPHTVAVTMIY